MTLEGHNLTVSYAGTLSPLLVRVPFLDLKEKILGKNYELSIAFVAPHVAKLINSERRDKNYTPNTLSFSLSDTSGEIVLCMSALKKQYKDFAMDLDTYIIYILIHSMLHLIGMAHGSTMDRKEKQLLTFFTSSHLIHETNHRSRY